MLSRYFMMIITIIAWVSPAYAIKVASENKTAPATNLAFDGVLSKDSSAQLDSNTMRQGKIQEVDFKKQTLTINNTELHFDSKKLKVFSERHSSSVTMLSKGRVIQFLLDPQDEKYLTISVVYIN